MSNSSLIIDCLYSRRSINEAIKIPNTFSTKTQKVLTDYSKSKIPDSVDDFVDSEYFKNIKKIYKRMEEIDVAAEDSLDSESIKEYKKEFTALKKEFNAAEKLYNSLCRKLPGGNWSELPSGSKERVQAVDDYEKSEKLRKKIEKVFYPSSINISFFKL